MAESVRDRLAQIERANAVASQTAKEARATTFEEELAQQDLIKDQRLYQKSDIAKALAPHVKIVDPYEGANAALGSSVRQRLERTRSIEKRDGFEAEGVNVLSPKEVEALTMDQKKAQAARNVVGQYKEAMGGLREAITSPFKDSPFWHKVGNILNAEEHAEVKSIYKLLGEKTPKPDISDYTFTNYYKEKLGMPDNELTRGLGIVTAIATAPSTWIPGLGAFKATAKLAGTEAKLTAKGTKLLNAAVAEKTQAAVALKQEELKRALTKKEYNHINEGVRSQLEGSMVKKLSDLEKQKKVITQTGVDSLDKLGASAFDAGGLKFMDHTLISGKEIAWMVEKSGLNKAMQKVGDFSIWGKTPSDLANDLRKAFTDRKTEVVKDLSKLRLRAYDLEKQLSKTTATEAPGRLALEHKFVLEQVKSLEDHKRIIDLFDYSNRTVQRLTAMTQKQTEKWFSVLNKKQRLDFGNTALEASIKSQEIVKGIRTGEGPAKFEVKTTSGDKTVQKLLDDFYGQLRGKDGEFLGWTKGKSIADQIGERAKIIEGTGVPIWFPGITEGVLQKRFSLDRKLVLAERAFNRERDLANRLKYTRDPYQAILHRQVDIIYANMQDKIYYKIIKEGLGGAKVPKDAKEFVDLTKAGYVPITRPTRLSNPSTIANELGKDKFAMVKPEFSEAFNKILKQPEEIGTLRTWYNNATRLFKKGVYPIFPNSHARNATSAIIANAYEIGGQALPMSKSWRAAMTMAFAEKGRKSVLPYVGANIGLVGGALTGGAPGAAAGLAVGAASGKLAAKFVEASKDLILGDKLNVVRTDLTGAKYTLNQYMREMEKYGVTRKGDQVSDIMGMKLKGAASDAWNQTLWWANPLNWGTGKVAGESFNIAAEHGGRMAQFVETQARAQNYFAWRQQGVPPELAAEYVNKAHFDYLRHSDFEKKILAHIPFYTYRSRNFQKHMAMVRTNPGLLAAQLKFMNKVLPTEEELKDMPDRIKRQFVARIGTAYYSGLGAPIEDFLTTFHSPLRETILSLNPLIRFGAEEALSQKDYFSGRDLFKVNNAQEFAPVIRLLEDPSFPGVLKIPLRGIKETLGLKREIGREDKVIGNPLALHFLRSIFTSRFQSVMGQIEKQGDEKVEGYEHAVRWLLGGARIPDTAGRNLSEQNAKELQEMKESGYRGGLRGAEEFYWYSNDKAVQRAANQIMKKHKKAFRAEDSDEMKDITKEFKEFVKENEE